jgi:uncharacterized protein (DUF1015 family)
VSDVRPFRAFRPRPGLEAQIATPPYDVLSTEEARAMAKGNPLSFLRVTKSEIELSPDVSPYDPRVYARAAENFQKLISKGYLIREAKPCFYVYQQRMGEHVQAGFVAGVSVAEYQEGLVKKHEHTRPDKEDDRTRHIDATNANTGPVFLAFHPTPELDSLLAEIRAEKPVYDFTASDGIGHTVWVVSTEGVIRRIREGFARVPALYVADGHHRSAAASRVHDRRKAADPTGGHTHFQAVIFPKNQLRIMDYNRVVKDLNQLTPETFLARVQEKFEVRPSDTGRPERAKTFGMYLGGRWYRLAARPGTYPASDPVRSLDVAVLQENLLRPLLGIEDPRTDKRIDFIGGIRGLGELERRVREGWAVAFAMFPTSMDDLMRVADAGQVMPPKSTWFEPKLRDGLIVRCLDEASP